MYIIITVIVKRHTRPPSAVVGRKNAASIGFESNHLLEMSEKFADLPIQAMK